MSDCLSFGKIILHVSIVINDGPIYHPASPLISHVNYCYGLMGVTIFVPGGGNDVAAKLNSPNICVYILTFLG